MSASTPPPRRLGCCSGCLLLLVVTAALIGAGGYYVSQNLDRVFSGLHAQMREGTRKQLEKLEQAGNVPEEHQALYEELKRRVLSPETSMLALHAVQESLHDALSDNTLDATEVAMLKAALNFLRRYPQPTFQQWWEFGTVHDGLRRGTTVPTKSIDVAPEAEETADGA